MIGELFFFRLCNRLLCSYLEPGLAPLERLKLAFAAMFMSEGWFTHLKEADKKRKDAERIAKDEEKARVCSERGITKAQYTQEQREKRKHEKEVKKAEKQKQKREAQEQKEALKAAKKKQKKNASSTLMSLPSLELSPPPPPAATKPPPTVAAQFITRTAAAGISFNAWFLLGFMCTLITNDELRRSTPFAPRQLNEQEAEKIFRSVRAVLGGENFTLADFLRRCNDFTAHAIIKARHSGVDFVYPQMDKAWRWDEKQVTDRAVSFLPATLTLEDLCLAIESAQKMCVKELSDLGIDVAAFDAVLHLDCSGSDLAELDELDEEQPSVNAAAPTAAPEKSVAEDTKEMQMELEILAEVPFLGYPFHDVACLLTLLLRV